MKLIKQLIEMASGDPKRMTSAANEYWKEKVYHPSTLGKQILDLTIRRMFFEYHMDHVEDKIYNSDLGFTSTINDSSLERLGIDGFSLKIQVGIITEEKSTKFSDIKTFPNGVVSTPKDSSADRFSTHARVHTVSYSDEKFTFQSGKTIELCNSPMLGHSGSYFTMLSLASSFNYLSKNEKMRVINYMLNSIVHFKSIQEELINDKTSAKIVANLINSHYSWRTLGISFSHETLSFQYVNTVEPNGVELAKEVTKYYQDNAITDQMNNLKANHMIKWLLNEDQYNSYNGYMKLTGKGADNED